MAELLDGLLTKVRGDEGLAGGGGGGGGAPGGLLAHMREPCPALTTSPCPAPPSLPPQVQAACFLLAGHPFCWNGLSFAHAVASMDRVAPALPLPQPQPVAPAPQAAQPQAEARQQAAQAPAQLQRQLADLLAACVGPS